MKIFVAQLNPTIGALDANTKKIIHFLKKAKESKADIVIFPELTICGYPPADFVLHTDFIAAMEKALLKIIPETKGLMAVVGMVRNNLSSGEKSLFNSAAVLQEGKLVGFYDKMLLPTYDVFDEKRYFEEGKTVPVWQWKGKKIGILICEDIWQHAGYVGSTHYLKDPVLELLPLRPDVVLNLSASPYRFQKPDTRVKVCQKAAKTLQCPVILCCQVGANDQLVFDGYSIYVNKESELCQLGKGFQEDVMLIDIEAKTCPCPFKYDSVEDLYQALVMGTRDYFQKQGFKKGLLGLSGGIDSALVACIAKEALGGENVYGVSLPSRYTSQESLEDAEKLARNLHIKFDTIPIDKTFQGMLDLLHPFFQDKKSDVTEENIQARIRGLILMALSNKLGYLVLSTGNKSEMAMGYCTLYGDTAGGLAVIFDVTKTQVYALAKWINRNGEVIPFSCLGKPPSAELRAHQKDTDSLPADYITLDKVIEAYVEDFIPPEIIAEKYEISLNLVREIIKKIHLAEYKRRQTPPGIRVSKKALRIGRHYPIVQGWI